VSSIPKPLASILLLLALVLFGGCARHRVSTPMSDPVELGTDVNDTPDLLPGERIATSAPPTTGRYADTQPNAYPRSRIVVRVGEHGVIRRIWVLSASPRPSGDVLGGPYYWPSEDRAFNRPNSTNVWLEPGEFVWNTLLLPYRMFDTPPWSKVVYSPAGGAPGWRNVEQSGVIYRERE
jgi:hypothetical protein